MVTYTLTNISQGTFSPCHPDPVISTLLESLLTDNSRLFAATVSPELVNAQFCGHRLLTYCLVATPIRHRCLSKLIPYNPELNYPIEHSNREGYILDWMLATFDDSCLIQTLVSRGARVMNRKVIPFGLNSKSQDVLDFATNGCYSIRAREQVSHKTLVSMVLETNRSLLVKIPHSVGVLEPQDSIIMGSVICEFHPEVAKLYCSAIGVISISHKTLPGVGAVDPVSLLDMIMLCPVKQVAQRDLVVWILSHPPSRTLWHRLNLLVDGRGWDGEKVRVGKAWTMCIASSHIKLGGLSRMVVLEESVYKRMCVV